jgi:nucleotide-binding universal stress UspA family protein
VLTPADRDQLLADTKAFIEAETAPGAAIEAVIREGNTAAEIADQATKMSADLLVIGTHGRSGFGYQRANAATNASDCGG